jgi:hypothetical protein
MASVPLDTVVPNRWQSLWFAFRATGLRLQRRLRTLAEGGARRFGRGEALKDAPILAESLSALWPQHRDRERALVCGKVENLRRARLAFDGVEVPADAILSFWAQLGRPSRRRGFVEGRELREGCLVPSVGGGLCQLSNALYDAALRAGLDIVERHAHSQVVPGSLAECGRDATVFWNYIDLRLRADFPFRIEAAMDGEFLRLRIRGHSKEAIRLPLQLQQAAKDIGSCDTCAEDDCHRHQGQPLQSRPVTVVCGELWPEHRQFLRDEPGADARRISSAAPGALRSLVWRLHGLRERLRGGPVAPRRLAQARREADWCADRLRPDETDLIVGQDLLVLLWQRGVLAGRRYRVLMNALPMADIHARLQRACARHPQEPTLRDFRAPQAWLDAEAAALAQAEAWITPHARILELAGERGQALPWRLPDALTRSPRPRASGGLRVLFPSSSLARKGALELSAALQGEDACLLLPQRDGGDPARWGRLPVERHADLRHALSRCDVVALPAWVEHRPEWLLTAIASGIPVIATAACGLGALPGWAAVPAGDVTALRDALRAIAPSSAT